MLRLLAKDPVLVLVALPVGSILALSLALAGAPAGASTEPVACIAHRGGESTHTEETISTYAEAIAAGVSEVEGDTRFTSTGYPMMLHDATLGQFGAPTVRLDSVSTGTAKSYVSPAGDVIATLYELRTLLLDHPGVRLQLELKDAMTPARWDMIDSRVRALAGRVTLTSFSLTTVRQAQDRGYRTGLLAAGSSVTTAAPVYIQDWTTIEPDDVAAHRDSGVVTQAYTPDTEAAWSNVYASGVRTIITNKPVACVNYFAESRRK